MENELITVAMEIILHAGDGRSYLDKAFEEARKQNFDQADQLLEKAKEEIQKAHQSQTNVIQEEAAGKEYGYCLLFNHAQDTLMTIMSELRMITYLVTTYKDHANNE